VTACRLVEAHQFRYGLVLVLMDCWLRRSMETTCLFQISSIYGPTLRKSRSTSSGSALDRNRRSTTARQTNTTSLLNLVKS